MSVNKALSIIVPIYNMEKYLDNCVNSLLNQTYTNKEIILVDDGSTDSSAELCDLIAEKHPDVHTIHKRNGGLISAWVAGVKACKGDYVGFVDADDFLDDDYYDVLMRPINELLCDVSMCGFSLEGESNLKVNAAVDLKTGVYEGERLENIKNNYFNNINIQNSRCLKVYRKKLVIDNLGYIDEAVVLGEDMTITVPVILDSSRVFVNQEYFGYHYRIQTSSMSHSLKKGQVDNYFLLYSIILKEFKDKGYMNKYVHYEFKRQLVSVIGLIILSTENLEQKIALLRRIRENERVEYLLCLENNFLKKSWRLIVYLFTHRFYRSLCLLGSIKNKVNQHRNLNNSFAVLV